MHLAVNADRIWNDVMELGSIGAVPTGGITRPALGEADMVARSWLISRMHDAKLDVEVDAAMNIIGRLKSSRADAKTVIVGSHLDTVPSGGIFDGALGVLAGLECARVFAENNVSLPFDLEIVDFTDEEGYHNAGTVGSRAMLGKVTQEEIHLAKMPDIATFAEDMQRHGYEPMRISEAKRNLSTIDAYLELHIEQGAHLDESKIEIGVVTGIVGIYRYAVSIIGEANHAGTTPMRDRKDALVMAAPLFSLLPQWVDACSRQMVGTIGQVKVEPGAMNIIPGECRFIVELRAMEAEQMSSVRALIEEWVSARPGSSVRAVLEKGSVPMHQRLIDTVAKSAQLEGMQHVHMSSGAGHDAQSFAPYVPTGMIFVPSLRGKSHCPTEWTEREHVAAGCQVLLRTIRQLADIQ